MHTPYPIFTAAGSPRELGIAHGRQARERIDGYLDYLARLLNLSRGELGARAERFRPVFEQNCPHLLEEVAGLAEGAELPVAEALAAQIRGELGQVGDGACTTLVVGPRGTASGETLIGQNSDNPAELIDFGYVLHLRPSDRPEIVIWTFGGMLGYHGLNDHGVAHFANSLGGGPKWRLALPHYPLKRMILEQTTVTGVVDLMRRVPVCSNGNYVLSDGQGAILDVELTSDGPHLLEDQGAGFLVHSNHYLCREHDCQENFEQSLPDSFPRLERMRQLVEARFGSITLQDVQAMLSDHAGHPVGICRHPHQGSDHGMLPSSGLTVAALVAEPQRGRLHVSTGNPCENPFVAYSLGGD